MIASSTATVDYAAGRSLKARFDRQVEAEQQKLIAIAQDHIELQALPIGNQDAVPKPQFRKKKTHGLANARGLQSHPRLEL